MSSQSIDPRDVGRLRVSYRTKREFFVDHNLIAEGEYPSRGEMRRLHERLAHTERQALQARLNEQLTRFAELSEGERKTFDDPAVEHSDLVSGVRIPEFHD